MGLKASCKEADKATEGASQEDVPGPKAILTTIISKVKPKVMNQRQADPIADAEMGDKEIRQLIAENPQMNASTFYNLLKSKGCNITKPVAVETEPQKQADSSSAFTQMTRAQEGPKFDSCVDQVKKKGDVANPYAVCAASLGTTKESKHLSFTSNRFLESVKADVAKVEGRPENEIVGFTKFRVVLLQEGMGNFRDAYWYSKEALQSAVPVFEGAKIYADHPSAIDEATRPERTVRDILGHFEDVHLEEGDGGQSMLVGSVNILGDDSYRWARSLMEHAVEFSKKYPDKDFIGLSINADGDAQELTIDKLIESGVPSSALPKLQKAQNEGIDSVRFVSTITSCTSCDLVTEAGAGGRILTMLEGDLKMDKKDLDQKDPSELEGKKMMQADGEEMPHSDEQQDIELIKKMIKQYMGEEEDEASEEECGVVKEAYEAYKEMGEEEDEAGKKAVGHLKLAKHLASKKEAKKVEEADAREQEEAKKECEKKEDEAKVKESMISLKAENAKLRESLRKIEINNHVDSLCSKSKLPVHITKAFREAIGTPKSVEEVNKSWKLFEAGLKKADDELGGFAGLVIAPEKTTSTVGKKSLFEGVIAE